MPTKIKTSNITDRTVTAQKITEASIGGFEIASGAIAGADIASTFDLSGKTVTLPEASVTAHATDYDDNQLKEDIALVAFQAATAGSLAKYNLVDQTVDSFSDSSGIDLSASTNETHHTSGKYFDSPGANATKEFHTTNASFAISSGSVVRDIIAIGGGGAGGSNPQEGSNGYGSGGGGGAWAGALSYTVGSGITSINVTVGLGGLKNSSGTAPAGGTTSVAFGSDFTLTAAGGGGGIEEGAAGAGGAASKSGTSSGSVSCLFLTGGAGGTGSGTSTSQAGGYGTTGSLDSVSRTSPGGGGGGNGAGNGAIGGNGLASSFSGGGGGGGGDTDGNNTAGGSGYGTAGFGMEYGGSQNAGSVTIDSASIAGGLGGVLDGSAGRGWSNGGGGGMCGGGGGGSGDSYGGGGDGGRGYVRLTYATAATNMTLISNATTANDGPPTKGDLIITYSNSVGTTALGTDLKCYISRDGSAYTSAITMTAQGSTGSHNIAVAHDVDLSGITSGSSMRYKIETLNQSASKGTRINAVSLGWS